MRRTCHVEWSAAMDLEAAISVDQLLYIYIFIVLGSRCSCRTGERTQTTHTHTQQNTNNPTARQRLEAFEIEMFQCARRAPFWFRLGLGLYIFSLKRSSIWGIEQLMRLNRYVICVSACKVYVRRAAMLFGRRHDWCGFWYVCVYIYAYLFAAKNRRQLEKSRCHRNLISILLCPIMMDFLIRDCLGAVRLVLYMKF